MTTRRGAKGKFSIPSNFGFRRHHRDKKTKIKKNTYVRTRVKGGGNFRRNSMAVSKMGGGDRRSFRLCLCRDNSALSHPSLSSIQSFPPSPLVEHAVSRVNEAKEEGARRGGRERTFWFLRGWLFTATIYPVNCIGVGCDSTDS